MKPLLFLLTLFLLMACTKQDLHETLTVTVKEGHHNSTPYIYREGDHIDWEYELDFTEAQYDFQEPYWSEDGIDSLDQKDWNKFGIKEDYFHPTDNGYHMGWRFNKWLHVWEFAHFANVNGQMVINPPCFISSGKARVQFTQQGGQLFVNIEGNVRAYPVQAGNKLFLIPPYLGGNRKSPRDITIRVTRIK